MNIGLQLSPSSSQISTQWRNWDKIADVEIAVGSHIMTSRHGYDHHGIYIGNRRVIHYSGFCNNFRGGPIEELTLDAFSNSRPIWIRAPHEARYTKQEIVRRAMSRLGENHYRLLTNNCEHFCNWCLYGESYSNQVRRAITNPLSILQLLIKLLPTLVSGSPNQKY
ncbi:Lecithin retinol acyltransferase [compost metagenome]